ncbi:hypothetical protein [Cognatishimia sp. MH4019]|uniref:hypothetical protein n=1 Tax=Cognatishimia sp. MH4019 TaxID=2854030 RepID=UPI001CD2AA6E|nr:hypothetical protein [Cognatishimia sp. MH4019]
MKFPADMKRKLLRKIVKKTKARSKAALEAGHPVTALRWINFFSFWPDYRQAMRQFSVRQSWQTVRCLQAGAWHYHSRNPLLTDFRYMRHFLEQSDSYADRFRDSYLGKLYFGRTSKGPKKHQAVQVVNKPARVLVLTGNKNFIDGPVKALRVLGAEVRVFDTSSMFNALRVNDDMPDGSGFLSQAALYGIGRFGHSSKAMLDATAALEPELVEALTDWCDALFCDWASHNAIWFSKCAPKDKRFVVRCHSYEAFSHFPVFMRHRRIDQLIFIAPHIRDIYFEHPIDDTSVRQRSVFVQNIRPPEKPVAFIPAEERSFQLGMLGFGSMGKDPIFALEVLACLVAHNSRWTLHLAGHNFGEPGVDEIANEYAERFEKGKEPLSDHIVYSGFVTEKAEWFAKIGFVLSV